MIWKRLDEDLCQFISSYYIFSPNRISFCSFVSIGKPKIRYKFTKEKWAEKSFRNIIKSNRNQIIFTIFRFCFDLIRWDLIRNLIKSNWNQIIFTISRFQFDLTRLGKDFSVCTNHLRIFSTHKLRNFICV